MRKKEVIEVTHDIGDKYDTNINDKRFSFDYNGYHIEVTISGEGHFFEGMWITARHIDCEEGFTIRTHPLRRKLTLAIDHNGGLTETDYRSYREWLQLESIETALKNIGRLIK